MTEAMTSEQGESPAERFLTYVSGLGRPVEPRFFLEESTHPGLKGVSSLTFDGLFEPGVLTSFTYGVSHAEHEKQVNLKPELCISVASDDLFWAFAVAEIGERLRGDCPFFYGDVIRWGTQVTQGSDMSAFLVFAPAFLTRDQQSVDVGASLPLAIKGVYPIHESEAGFIQEHGVNVFWQLGDWDPLDVTRPPVV